MTGGRPGHGRGCGGRNAAVSVPEPVSSSSHTAQTQPRSLQTRPTCTAPLGGLPLRHSAEGIKMILPQLGSPSKIQLKGPGGLHPAAAPCTHTLSLPETFRLHPDHPQPLPWSISRCPHPHISWASVCTRTQGEGRKTPRFFNRKTS